MEGNCKCSIEDGNVEDDKTGKFVLYVHKVRERKHEQDIRG